MAQTVEDIVLRLGIKGFDSLDSVRGAFRQLSRVTQASERDITLAREAILNYADAGKVTTRIIDAQIAGLKSLQGQAVINSRTYTQLGADISTLKARFTEATQEVTRHTTVLDRQGSRVFGTSITAIKRYNDSLSSTRTELAATSRSLNTTTADIDRLTTSLKAANKLKLDINVDTNHVTQARGKVASALAFFKRMSEQASTPVGAAGRVFEGITAGVAAGQFAGPGAAMFGGGASTLAGLSGRAADMQAWLNNASKMFGGGFGDKLLGGLSENLAARSAELTNFQHRAEYLSGIVDSFTSALSNISPTAAVATGSVITAMAFMRQRVGNELDAVRADIDASFTAVTDDIQKLIVELSRLGDYIGRMSMAEIGQQLNRAREAFASVPAGSPRSRSFASQIAGLESVQRGEIYAQSAVLEEYRARVRGSSITIDGLNERLQYLKQNMAGVNRATAEGSATYAANANEVRVLENQLRDLAGAYRHVSDMATQAATAEQNAANARTRDNYLNRSRVIQQEQAYTRLAARILAETYRAPLMLPAAGQTSAPGTGQTVSGGPNVRLGRRRSLADVFGADVPTYGLPPGLGVQRFFGQGDIGLAAGTPTYGPAASPQQAERARSAYIANAAAARANAEAAQVLERRIESLRAEVTKADAANTGSITSLNRVRDAIHALRNELVPTSKEFEQYTQRLQRVDRQAARASAGPRRLSGMQMAQGVGAALSGGIFGGPEGLIGGLGGLAFGGVGGAFAGAAAGAQVGMFRQQLAGFADYAASLDKMKIALRGIVKDQASYNTVLAAANAATRELNVPQEAAIGGLTRLSAAILGAGGTVNQSTFAFRALTEAVTATGGKAEQVDGAMLALTQVFSKGKVSAEELNQIAERLPGTYTLFAEATGRTGPQLAKGLEQGKIGLNDLMKFLELLRTKHGQTALEIAASSENAGERLKVAYDKMREDVGRALQPLGAEVQNTLANALRAATPALTTFIQALVSNADLIANLTKQFLALGAVIGTAFATAKLVTIATDLVAVAGGATTAATAMGRLTLAFAAVPGIGWIAAGATALSLLTVELYNNNKAFKTWVDNFTSLIYNDFKKGWEDAVLITDAALKAMASMWLGLDTLSATAATSIANRFDGILGGVFTRLKNFWESLPAPLRQAMARDIAGGLLAPGNPATAYLINRGVAAARGESGGRRAGAARPTTAAPPSPFNFPALAGGGADSQATSAANAAKQQRDLFQQANEYINANIELLKARGQLSEEQAATEFDRANLAKKFAIDELTLRKQALDLQKKYNQITPDIYTKSLQTLDVERQKIETAYNKTVAQIGEDVSKINEEIFAGLGAPFDQRNVNEFERALDDLYQRVDKGVVDAEKKGGPPAAAFLKRARELTTADYQRAASRSTVETLTKQITELQRGKGEVTTLDTIIADYGDSWQKLEEPVRKHLEQLATTVDHLKEIQRYKQDPNTYAGLREGALAYVESIGTIRSNVADLAQTGFKGVEDSITSLMTTGTANFREFATSLIVDMTRVIVRQFIMRSLMQALGFLNPSPAAPNLPAQIVPGQALDPSTVPGMAFAKGGAFDAANRIVPFAYGGVVNKPTMFKFADGGLMRNGVAGEAGPEAIMPLRRLPSGRLGVESSGGGAAPITIQVNVDASGNQQMSGDAGQGQALGRVIAAVVQQELVNQKRPGGLLAS